MAAMPQDSQESYYTPQRVESLLRQLPYLLDRTTPDDGSEKRRGKRTSPAGRIEEQMAKRADVEWALNTLPSTTYRVVYLCLVGGKTLREVAEIVGYSHTTVRHHRIEGVNLMAWRLGWRDASAGWGELRYFPE